MFKFWQPVANRNNSNRSFEQVVTGIWQDFIVLLPFMKRWTLSFPIHSSWVFQQAVASDSAASNSCQSVSDKIAVIQPLVWMGLQVKKLSKLKKIITEREKDSNMATPIILPSLLPIYGKQRPLVGFVVPIKKLVTQHNKCLNIHGDYVGKNFIPLSRL